MRKFSCGKRLIYVFEKFDNCICFLPSGNLEHRWSTSNNDKGEGEKEVILPYGSNHDFKYNIIDKSISHMIII